jgi:hypothetical protein
MLNAVQNRMVEEALVEKGVYDAMLKIRADIDRMIGPGGGSATAEAGSAAAGKSAPVAAERSPSGMPLPDLPPAGRPPADRMPAITPSLREGPQPGPAEGATDAGIPAEVMAVGDPERDPNRPVAAYVPPTQPSDLASDPFPQLGLHGKPLG